VAAAGAKLRNEAGDTLGTIENIILDREGRVVASSSVSAGCSAWPKTMSNWTGNRFASSVTALKSVS
jgi:hypothetical protein